MKHFYRLYEKDDELIRIAALFLQEGLDKGEFCFWAIPDNLDSNTILSFLRGYIEMIDHYIKEDRMRMVKSSEWYVPRGYFDMDEVLKKWDGLYREAMSKGVSGVRVIGDASWVDSKSWRSLVEYESQVNSIIKNYKLTALCAFNIKHLKSVVHISEIITNHEACFITD